MLHNSFWYVTVVEVAKKIWYNQSFLCFLVTPHHPRGSNRGYLCLNDVVFVLFGYIILVVKPANVAIDHIINNLLFCEDDQATPQNIAQFSDFFCD